MEKIVTVVNQSPLRKFEWSNPRTGEKVLLKSKKIVVKDGIDSFECEAMGDLAEEIEEHPLQEKYPYSMQFKMEVKERERTLDNGGKEKYNATTIRLLSYGGM